MIRPTAQPKVHMLLLYSMQETVLRFAIIALPGFFGRGTFPSRPPGIKRPLKRARRATALVICREQVTFESCRYPRTARNVAASPICHLERDSTHNVDLAAGDHSPAASILIASRRSAGRRSTDPTSGIPCTA